MANVKQFRKSSTKFRKAPYVITITFFRIGIAAILILMAAICLSSYSQASNAPGVVHQLPDPLAPACWQVYGMEAGYCQFRARQ